MCDKLWVTLAPAVPDCDVIVRYFFKTGRKGNQTFKSGKTVVHFHIPNEIYDAMLENRDADDWPAEKNPALGKKPAGRRVTAASVKELEIEPSMAADFTVSILSCLRIHC